MTNEHKILRGLSYISVIFAPILFPILVLDFHPARFRHTGHS